MKKVLITGGKGYIARNLVPLFEQGGYVVDAPSRQEMDLLDCQRVVEYLNQSNPDYIIHAAAKGGRRQVKDTWEDVYVPNVKMFENLVCANATGNHKNVPIIILGSGAEFDRRWPIHKKFESHVFNEWPVDPYGLSKNIIARRALKDYSNIYVLRLFGCFNYDDDPARFITNSIRNIKQGSAITVHQDKTMDYFFLDDIYNVINYIIEGGLCPRNLNLVYKEKTTLVNLAKMINNYISTEDATINIIESGVGNSYTGDGSLLAHLPIKLIGLDEGIRHTVLRLS